VVPGSDEEYSEKGMKCFHWRLTGLMVEV
jgi:hypothetical protein